MIKLEEYRINESALEELEDRKIIGRYSIKPIVFSEDYDNPDLWEYKIMGKKIIEFVSKEGWRVVITFNDTILYLSGRTKEDYEHYKVYEKDIDTGIVLPDNYSLFSLLSKITNIRDKWRIKPVEVTETSISFPVYLFPFDKNIEKEIIELLKRNIIIVKEEDNGLADGFVFKVAVEEKETDIGHYFHKRVNSFSNPKNTKIRLELEIRDLAQELMYYLYTKLTYATVNCVFGESRKED